MRDGGECLFPLTANSPCRCTHLRSPGLPQTDGWQCLSAVRRWPQMVLISPMSGECRRADSDDWSEGHSGHVRRCGAARGGTERPACGARSRVSPCTPDPTTPHRALGCTRVSIWSPSVRSRPNTSTPSATPGSARYTLLFAMLTSSTITRSVRHYCRGSPDWPERRSCAQSTARIGGGQVGSGRQHGAEAGRTGVYVAPSCDHLCLGDLG